MLTVGSLFSGIGGLDLGLERAGMRVVWQCEQDPFCRRVLARHWPGVPCHPDVRTLVANAEAERCAAQWPREVEAETDGLDRHAGERRTLPVPVPYVDVLCGGFPCQDISLAGRGAGLAGERSGLWRDFARLIGELRPRYVLVENVPALTSRGLDVVLADLAACGLDAEWDHLPASAFGAPHRRDRIWLVAYSNAKRGDGWRGSLGDNSEQRVQPANGRSNGSQRTPAFTEPNASDTDGPRLEGGQHASATRSALGFAAGGDRPGTGMGWWLAEPDVGRVANGIPARVDRLRALGNSLVPQIAEWIGRQILAWEVACRR
jgi:DNA (cytosine-5)-methyltransferase 1